MTDSLDTGNSSATMSIESEWEAAMNEQNNTPRRMHRSATHFVVSVHAE